MRRSLRRNRPSVASGQKQDAEICLSDKTPVRQRRGTTGSVSGTQRRLRSAAKRAVVPAEIPEGLPPDQVLEKRMQELLEMQQWSEATQRDDAAMVEATYRDLNAVAHGACTLEEMNEGFVFLRICPDGQIQSFFMEGWVPFPWAPQPPPVFHLDSPQDAQNTEGVGSKKRKSRAHVLQPGELSLIPYGQEERVLWTKRIFHFVGKMRKVLGDRRIVLPWGGSILDSVIGVYVTQNVSDTFSSKAFMNIAAKFPSPTPKQRNSDIVNWQRVLHSPVSELSDCIECRGMQNILAHRIRRFLKQVEDGMVWEWWTEQLKPSTKSKHPLRPRSESAFSDQDPGQGTGLPAMDCRLFKVLEQIQSDLNSIPEPHLLGYVPGELSLEWLRRLDCESVSKLLTSNLEGFGEKSAACVTLLCFHWESFPVDVNVARICARLGWIPLRTAEKIEDLDLYAPELEVHKYLKERLSHFDFQTLYELHYLMITMGKVFCTKSHPRCSACPLRNRCEYASSGGKRFERKVSVKKSQRLRKSEKEGDPPEKSEPLKDRDPEEDAAFKTPVKSPQRGSLPSGGDGDIEDLMGVCSCKRPFDSVSSVHQKMQQLAPEPQEKAGTKSSESEICRILSVAYGVAAKQEPKHPEFPDDRQNPQLMSRDVALRILDLNSEENEHTTRFRYRSLSRLIHPDKCLHSDAGTAFALVNQAYHTLSTRNQSLSESSCSEAMEEDTKTESFAVSHLPLAIYTPLTFTHSRNILHAFRFCSTSVVLPFVPAEIQDLLRSDLFLLPDPRAAAASSPDGPAKVFALMTAKDILDSRFPLNGTYFQTNELFLLDGPVISIPERFLRETAGVSIVRVYFGTSVSRITLGMGTAEVTHLFNHSYICVRNFDFATRQATKLHAFLSP